MADAVRAAGAEQGSYSRWRSSLLRAQGQATTLSSAGLEAAVMSLAQRNPEYIVFGEGA